MLRAEMRGRAASLCSGDGLIQESNPEPPPAAARSGACPPGQEVSAWVDFCGLGSASLLLGH